MPKNILTFKRWSNKGYASFVSMRQVVRIGVLSLGCSLLTLPGARTFASTDREVSRTLNLKDVEVTAQQNELDNSVARTTTILTSELTTSIPQATLNDALRYAPSIDIRQRGGEGVQADVCLRGGNADQFQILLNGINVTDPQTGHYNLDLPVLLSDVERIEILDGPDSKSYGAFAGAINIVTATSPKSEYTLGQQLGDHGFALSKASARYVKDNTTFFGSANYSRSDGYTQNTDFDIFNLFAQCRHRSKWSGNMNVQVGFQSKGYGAQSFYSFNYPYQYEKTTTALTSVSSVYKLGHFTLAPKAFLRTHLDKFELFRDKTAAPAWYTQANYHQTDVLGAEMKASLYSALGKTTIGISFRKEHIFSTVIGDKSDSAAVWFDRSESACFDHEKSRTILNSSAQHSAKFKSVDLSATGAWNYSQDYGNHFTGGADLGWLINSDLRVFASVNRTLRLPTFTELYYSSKDHVPNPQLQPEKSTTYESGLRYSYNIGPHNAIFQANATAFYRQGDNIIDWIRSVEETTWHTLNHTNVNSTGCNLWIRWSSPHSFFQEILTSYDFVHLDKNAKNFQSQYALDYLKHKVTATVKHMLYRHERRGDFSACWTTSFNQREGNYLSADGSQRSYSPFVIINTRLSWRKNFDKNIQHLTCYVDLDNLTDNHYCDYGGIRQAGLWIKGGFDITF